MVTEGTETVLEDPVTAQYTHTLTETGSPGGTYTCTVANNKPSSGSSSITLGEQDTETTLPLGGVLIIVLLSFFLSVCMFVSCYYLCFALREVKEYNALLTSKAQSMNSCCKQVHLVRIFLKPF